MKKTNKLLNLLINYTEKVCKTTYLMNVNMIVNVIFLLGTLMKEKNESFFLNMNMKIELFFSNIKIKFDLEPRS